MSIKIARQTVVGPGNEIYVGKNGNFFVGNKDLGIKALSDTELVTQEEFDLAHTSKLYYVLTTDSESTDPIVELWYIDADGTKYPVSGNNYIVPEIGDNGNWFVGKTDTGKPAAIPKTEQEIILYETEWNEVNSVPGLYVQNIVFEGMVPTSDIDVALGQCDQADILTYAEQFSHIILYRAMEGYIQFYSDMDLTVTIPVLLTYSSAAETIINGGARIDDNSINLSTVWSSRKLVDYTDEFKTTVESLADGKNLEFEWAGTLLGIRQQGFSEYMYSNLRGPVGLTGIDGSSIVDAVINEKGHLMLTIQDDEAEIDTTKMLTLESGAFTAKDLLAIQNSINRINNDLAAIKTPQFRQIVRLDEPNEEYKHVCTLGGCGTIQFFTTRFTGKARITVDGIIYEGEFTDISQQSANNLLVTSVHGNTVLMNPTFTTDISMPLNIVFADSCKLELIVNENSSAVYPSILIQGDYYYNGDFGEESSQVPDLNAITDEELNAILESIFDDEE